MQSTKFEGGIYTAKTKKTTKDEVRKGLKRLAFGDIKDAVLLLFAQEGDVLSRLGELDLYNISEIKRPKGGGMEIKFFDRIKALEKLSELEGGAPSEPLGFYQALEESAKCMSKLRGDDPIE